ncbi:MAG: hypothetical protein IT291_06820 [Deltaproteobacteria bacterium]|nr:hypothetical protein [Deltaproteobacteria bacterium]
MKSDNCKTRCFVALLFLLFLMHFVACAPAISNKIPVPRIDDVNVGEVVNGNLSNGLAVELFGDGREVAESNSEAEIVVVPEGSIDVRVKFALERALQNKGFAVSSFAPKSISGEVRNWSAVVKEGFVAEISSEATIYIELSDASNKRLFSGEYSGTSIIKRPGVNRTHVEQSLSKAMSEAMSQMFRDRKLMALLGS